MSIAKQIKILEGMISLIGIRSTRRMEEIFFEKRFLASEGLEQGVQLSEQGSKE